MNNLKIVLIIVTLVFINFVSAQSNPKAEISFDCDKMQGFNFQPDNPNTVGHVTYMKISSGTVLNNDLTVTDPLAYPQTVPVVGVMTNINWLGGVTDAIYMTFLISTPNKQTVSALLHTSITNTEVQFDFNVYSYDPLAKEYYKAWYPANNAILLGLIEKNGNELNMSVSDNQDMEIMSPIVFEMTIGIMPQDVPQELLFSTSITQTIIKQWGIGNPAVPELVTPDNGSSTYDPTPLFDWNDIYTATSYNILVDNNSDFSSPEINQSPSASTYTPGAALGLGTYFWKVLATNASGSSSYSSTRSFTLPQLATPTNMSTNVNGTDFFIDWDDVPGATGYIIYSADDPYNGPYTYEATVTYSEYSVPLVDPKKFYIISAIVE